MTDSSVVHTRRVARAEPDPGRRQLRKDRGAGCQVAEHGDYQRRVLCLAGFDGLGEAIAIGIAMPGAQALRLVIGADHPRTGQALEAPYGALLLVAPIMRERRRAGEGAIERDAALP